VGTCVLFALYALATSALIGLSFKQLWRRHDHRTVQEKWEERERLLDRPSPRVPMVKPEPVARVLFIVARDQRELVGFLHEDYAAEEAEGVIEILLDRRQGPHWQGARPREADGRRDPHRNGVITTNLRELGCALVRQPAPLPETARSMTHTPDPVALGG
jgi:hypothetical protein